MSITAGQKLNGKITSVKKFGAFVELENGKSGLVHISELSEKFVEKVEDVVSVGQEVTVRVKEVTPEGKINLSMKPARPERPARPALDLDKAITNFLKDSDEKQTSLKKNLKINFSSKGAYKNNMYVPFFNWYK